MHTDPAGSKREMCSRFAREKSCMQGGNPVKIEHLARIANTTGTVLSRKTAAGDFEQTRKR